MSVHVCMVSLLLSFILNVNIEVKLQEAISNCEVMLGFNEGVLCSK